MDAFQGPYTQHQLARIYILVGKYDEALDQLEPLLKIPYWLSPAWLRSPALVSASCQVAWPVLAGCEPRQ